VDVTVVCEAACFLAFFRHFFLALPDFFLHADFALWASISLLPRVIRPPKMEPVRRRRASRREGVVERERERTSKRSASMVDHLL
jgi:hypothetical protein